ncbi:hypothetical protein GPL15_20590 [Clostridium sp. MCC353]|uniref:hypothetical protein n=1 Tax=Clostridium sp. MCC353 TaxID=2592646 RepID=UPI001C02E6FC|nr:hypothetical protein [Clostridium sp. MCC353]MBT9778878.1 hypothetical protein [Clostridium sp. MCC353]
MTAYLGDVFREAASSGGAIACGLIGKPEILYVDEPTYGDAFPISPKDRSKSD